MVVGKYLRQEYCSVYFAKGNNIRRLFREQVNQLLDDVDVLVTPTTPIKAFKLTAGKLNTKEWAERAGAMLHNTCPLNITGHPALTIPCGSGGNGLPIGMQLIGKYFAESLLFRVGYTHEEGAK